MKRKTSLNERFEKGNKIDLIAFGDFHYGAKECDVKGIKKQIEWIRDNPNARVILMGDLLNCGTRYSIGAGSYDDDFIPQKQYEDLIKILQPIKNKIYGIHIGNHETRIFNLTGINITKMIADKLNIRYFGYACFHKINYVLYTTHGSSGATLPYTKIKNCLDLANSFNADVYCMGHVHSVQVLPQEYRFVDMRDGTVKRDKKYFVLTGHYLNYEDSYAESKNMRPDKKGCAKIRLDGIKKDVHVSV